MDVIRPMAIALAILIVTAAGISAFVARQRRRAAEPMRAALSADIDAGSCGRLRRAQALARRLVLADAHDADAQAALSFTGALLAIDCGEPLGVDATVPAPSAAGAHGADETTRAEAGAAAALIRLHSGQRGEAAVAATAAVAAAPNMPQPLYALARVRAYEGDLDGASRAFEAAMVAGPGFMPPRVAWAEVRLDLGDVDAAAVALRETSTATAADLRARLLMEEVLRAHGPVDPRAPVSTELDAACGESHLATAIEVAGCALRDATRARLAGDRARARVNALTAAALAPEEPRFLARTAQLLAALGAVDQAAALVTRAERLAAPGMPALAWAEVALALGRGRVPARPAAPPPPAPEGPPLEVRAALAAGGVGGLSAAFDKMGPRATRSGDPDLEALARLRAPAVPGQSVPHDSVLHAIPEGPARAARDDDDPLRAYVAGLRARLAGDVDGAAQHLSRALAGHGDACRAAGEYVATLRALKLKPAPEAFAPLRAENAGCVNLLR